MDLLTHSPAMTYIEQLVGICLWLFERLWIKIQAKSIFRVQARLRFAIPEMAVFGSIFQRR